MVILRDVIKILAEDILNAMAYALWKMSYQEVIDYRTKEYDDFVDEFTAFISEGKNTIVGISIGGYELFEIDKLSLMCSRFNNFRHTKYVTDTFLVSETYDDYFKVSLLNEFDKREFRRLGKLEEIRQFLNELEFPYKDEQKTFFRMTVGFN